MRLLSCLPQVLRRTGELCREFLQQRVSRGSITALTNQARTKSGRKKSEYLTRKKARLSSSSAPCSPVNSAVVELFRIVGNFFHPDLASDASLGEAQRNGVVFSYQSSLSD